MKVSRRAALSEDERLDALGRLLTDTEIPTRLRVAGVIVLLYAQPVSRIVPLTVDDVIRDSGAVLLRLGEPASPVPAPVAVLLLEHIAETVRRRRSLMVTSWLGSTRNRRQLKTSPPRSDSKLIRR
ncbi:hypothetical protein [Streptomyces coffeae]|uniref:hypothetical protein n=1 Tax=Streptomyces coffeae TaxID=621382 RepID=UPI001F442F49|nr:hypothetical protein [Streptomyces coffeae]